jgi:hypothetical protein
MWVDNSPVAATDLDPGESGLTFRFGVSSVSVTPQPTPACSNRSGELKTPVVVLVVFF